MSKSKADIWMPIYVGDYLKDTPDLSLTEHGAFFKLLMAYWQNGCLEHCLSRCSRIAGAYTQAEQDAVATVIKRFFYVEGNLLKNKRMDKELNAAKAKQDKAHDRAAKAAAARWSSHSDATSNATSNAKGMLEECPSPSPSPSPSHIPIPTASPKPNESSRKRSDSIDAVFDHWKTVMGHPKAGLDSKRSKLIADALKLGYSVEDLKQAITGCSITPHNIGMNENGQRYDGLHIILKSADQIDRFIRNSLTPPKLNGRQSRIEAINQQAMEEFLSGSTMFGEVYDHE